jgi:hypothetical protein
MATRLEQLAEAVLARRALEARSLVQEMVRAGLIGELVEPATADPPVRVVAAALAELLAGRHALPAPEWTSRVGPLSEPFFAVERALRWPRLREECEREAPEPLRRRAIYAPAGFLTYA